MAETTCVRSPLGDAGIALRHSRYRLLGFPEPDHPVRLLPDPLPKPVTA